MPRIILFGILNVFGSKFKYVFKTLTLIMCTKWTFLPIFIIFSLFPYSIIIIKNNKTDFSIYKEFINTIFLNKYKYNNNNNNTLILLL